MSCISLSSWSSKFYEKLSCSYSWIFLVYSKYIRVVLALTLTLTQVHVYIKVQKTLMFTFDDK